MRAAAVPLPDGGERRRAGGGSRAHFLATFQPIPGVTGTGAGSRHLSTALSPGPSIPGPSPRGGRGDGSLFTAAGPSRRRFPLTARVKEVALPRDS